MSAYTGENVEQAFSYLISQLILTNKSMSSPIKKNTFKLEDNKAGKGGKDKQKKKCCD